jgi:putative oxidoreductase
MRSKAVIVARVLLGLVFFVFGLNGFLHWFPLPTMNGAAAEFMGWARRQRVLLPAAFWEVYGHGGRAPDRRRFVPLALTVLAPVIVNIGMGRSVKLSPSGPDCYRYSVC